MSTILQKLWGKNKTNEEKPLKFQFKDQDNFHITFDNYENPKGSFTIDLNHPNNVYFSGASDDKNTQPNDGTEIIMRPNERQRRSTKSKEPDNEENFFDSTKNSIVLSQPHVITWKNKDAYVYKVESKYYKDSKRPDLEFVIYIPIDTAVKWLDSTMGKSLDYNTSRNKISENSNPAKNSEGNLRNKSSGRGINYGVEEDDESNHALLALKKSMSWSSESETDEDEPVKGKRKPEKIKEKKVKGPKMKRKIAGRIEKREEGSSISLGRLRPQHVPKEPVKIVQVDHF